VSNPHLADTAPADTAHVSRVVRVEDVQTPPWSTRALAWGYDVNTGEHVAFAVDVERGGAIRAELEADGEAFYKPTETEVLFVLPAGDVPRES
jgi:hypothetical protein